MGSSQTAYQVPMGYEIAVTPLQLAAGYATFANGGELIEPALVKEILAPDGTVLYKHTPRVVRRVISKPVAEKVTFDERAVEERAERQRGGDELQLLHRPAREQEVQRDDDRRYGGPGPRHAVSGAEHAREPAQLERGEIDDHPRRGTRAGGLAGGGRRVHPRGSKR